MSRTRTLRPHTRRMAGVSLIEVLVSLAIGLVLMVAAISAYLGSAGAGRMADAQGRMNEDAQAALAILTQHVRMTGNNPRQPNYGATTPRNPAFDTTGGYSLRGCDGGFTDPAAATIGALACTGGAGADALAVAYEADEFNTVKTTDDKATDCLGQALPVITAPAASVLIWNAAAATTVPSAPTFTMADNRFYIQSGNGNASLYCKGNGAARAQPLVENIVDMQISYGVAPTAAVGSLTVAGYLQAADFTGGAKPGNDAVGWGKVASVRICVVVRSEQPVAPDTTSSQYYDCDDEPVTPGDLYLRRAYSTTVVLRNRLVG